MKRGTIETYPEWLTTVEESSLRNWLKEEARLITSGNEFALIYVGPYPIKQDDKESDAEVDKQAKQIKVKRTLRLQWYAAEIERRENGGEVTPKVRL